MRGCARAVARDYRGLNQESRRAASHGSFAHALCVTLSCRALNWKLAIVYPLQSWRLGARRRWEYWRPCPNGAVGRAARASQQQRGEGLTSVAPEVFRRYHGCRAAQICRQLFRFFFLLWQASAKVVAPYCCCGLLEQNAWLRARIGAGLPRPESRVAARGFAL